MITNNFKCSLCGHNRHRLVASRLRDGSQKSKVYCCITCGHVQLYPQPTIEKEKAYYDLNQQDKSVGKKIYFSALKKNNQFDTDRHIAFVSKFCRSKRSKILDVGAGYGFFIDGMFRRGYHKVVGVEISQERRMIGKRNISAPLFDADILSEIPKGGPFDVITMFHVLEHTRNPVDFLLRSKALLKKGGILICEVPNVEELLLRTCKAYNDFYWIRAHLHYFSAITLKECLKKAGYKRGCVYFEQRYGLENLFHWLRVGKPQIENPAFTIASEYADVENYYKKQLSVRGVSDALIAIGYT
jgi:2-polyprenyl-3-methyl-5-hydroxy-6-metoxy-1,4-benzoquinol methylase